MVGVIAVVVMIVVVVMVVGSGNDSISGNGRSSGNGSSGNSTTSKVWTQPSSQIPAKMHSNTSCLTVPKIGAERMRMPR